MNVVDILFIVFSALTLYFGLLFVFLHTRNKKAIEDVPKTKTWPSMSIIVPAYNEEENIESVVQNLKGLKYPKKVEIIVVDDGSTDRTASLARKSGAKVITQKNSGKAAALNTGIDACHGTIVACVDADSYPERDSLLKSVPFFSENDVGAVTARVLVKKPTNFLQKLQSIEYAMIAWSRKLSEYIEGIYATPGPLALYRKDLLVKFGGFDTKNATEDIEIAWRLLDKGYKIRMSPAVADTQPPRRWKGWLKQRLRWNIGGIQTALKYRHATFRKGSQSFGFFVLPTFTLSYALSLLALGLFTYLIYIWIFNNLSFVFAAWAAGVDPFRHWGFQFLPDVLTVFGIILFCVSLYITNAGLKDMRHTRSPGSWLGILFYLWIYITIFPFLLLYSIIKFLQGYREW